MQNLHFERYANGAGEMAQELRPLAALEEDTGWCASTHMIVHHHL